MKFKSVNPYNNELNGEFEFLTEEEAVLQIKRSKEAFKDWKVTPVKERLQYLVRAAGILRDKKRKYGEIITREMGKPIKESLAEVEKCAWGCDYYAEQAEEMLLDKTILTEAEKSYVSFEPLGVILAIMPWNFPFWQVFRFAAPSLAAGNVAILKHAPNVPLSALAVEEIFRDAGAPENVFKNLFVDVETTMNLVEKTDGVTLTGSYRAGSQIGSLAGKYIKPVVLELGGSDPFIVLEDCDIDKCAESAVMARHLNAGQSCIASKRFIVVETVFDEFVEKFTSRFNKLRLGDPMDDNTDIGPMASLRFVQELERQVSDARERGAEVIELKKPVGECFFPPTLVVNATRDMKICSEEVFGPITPVIKVKDEEEALVVANNSDFGLGGSIWTKNFERGMRLAKRVESGTVTINDFTKSDPRLPFGGIKTSGIGRELSEYGLKEFVNVKTVVVKI